MFKKYPLPWSIENLNPEWTGVGSYIITAADGTLVIHGGTYSGDGDLECNFTYLQAKELVGTVNAAQLPLHGDSANASRCNECGKKYGSGHDDLCLENTPSA